MGSAKAVPHLPTVPAPGVELDRPPSAYGPSTGWKCWVVPLCLRSQHRVEVLGRPPLPTVPALGEVLGRPQSSFFFSVPALGEVLRPARPRRGSSVAIHFGRPVAIPPIHWGGQLGLSRSLGTALLPLAGNDVGPLRDDLKQTTIRCEPIADQRSHALAQHHLILRLRTQCKQQENCQKGSPQSGSHVRAFFVPGGAHSPSTHESPTHASEIGEVG